jgi:hypothetical protein
MMDVFVRYAVNNASMTVKKISTNDSPKIRIA